MAPRHSLLPEDQLIPHPMENPDENAAQILNDVSHLYHGRMRLTHGNGIMEQHSARTILAALAAKDGLRQVDLVSITRLKAPTVSVIVKRLSNEGLISHEVQFSDLRAVRLHLTPKGRLLQEEVCKNLVTTDAIALRDFTEEELEQLKGLLRRMRENLLTTLNEEGSLYPAVRLEDLGGNRES